MMSAPLGTEITLICTVAGELADCVQMDGWFFSFIDSCSSHSNRTVSTLNIKIVG